jgi:ribosomal protein S12 methylthiotransferase accessory factor
MDAAAQACCLGEVAERTALRRPPSTIVAAGSARIDPEELTLFSERQMRHGPHLSEALGRRDLDAPPLWTPTRDRRGCPGSAAPAHLVAGTHPLLSSNGVAAHRTRRAAEDAALLELAERDAVAIWWFARCLRPPVAPDLLDDAGGASLRSWLSARARKTHWLDLTHDLGVPVVAAISADPDGAGVAYGFAAKTTHAEAAVSATLEMLQIEISIDLAARRTAMVGRAEGSGGVLLTWSRHASLDRLPHLAPSIDARRMAPAGDPVASLLARNPVFVDLDRPGDPLPVVRAILPGLRPWTPRFAPGRLFDVPRSLGWEHTPIDETAVEDVILI